MRKLLLAVLPAFLLTACAGSTHSTLSYSPVIPPVRRQADGSATSADAEGSLRDARADLALCDVRRGLAVDAWPR